MQKVDRMEQYRLKEEGDYDITDALRFERNDIGRFLLRLMVGGLMLFHGIHKLVYGTEMVNKILANVGLPVFFSFGVLIGEVLAPIMLILGFKVRVAAAVVAFNMLMATLLVHSSQLTQVSEMGGWMIELNALYFLGSIAIIFLGSGRYAVTKGRGVLD